MLIDMRAADQQPSAGGRPLKESGGIDHAINWKTI